MPFTQLELEVLPIVAGHVGLAIANAALLAQVADAAIRDPLTGLFNRRHLDAALERLLAAGDRLDAGERRPANQKTVRTNTLAALAGIYSEPPKQDATKAFEYMSQLLQEAPNDTKNLYAIANLHEKFNQVPEAEAAYKKVTELNPNDAKACSALATFYNKPLWEGRSRFDEATATLERCANLDPNDATGFHRVAQFFWDKAYRDPLLTDVQKEAVRRQGPRGGGEVAADQARLLGGHDHQGPSLPGEGHGGQEPEGARRVPRTGRHHPEAGPRPAQAAAGRGGRGGGGGARSRGGRGAAPRRASEAPRP